MRREKVDRDSKAAREHVSNVLGRMEGSQRRPEPEDARAHLNEALLALSGDDAEPPADTPDGADSTAEVPETGETLSPGSEEKRPRRLFRRSGVDDPSR